MTYQDLTTRVMSRLNLSSTTAQTRVQQFINERYRAIVTSCNLGRVRRGTISSNTVASTATLTPTGLIKPITISIPALNRVLKARTEDQLRNMDPAGTWSGAPEFYAVIKYASTTFTLEFRPVPDAIYALEIDGLLAGTDMSSNSDVPAFPEDFHDALIFGAVADEYDHMDKPQQAIKMEKKFDERTSDLRYFIAKDAYLHRGQNMNGYDDVSWWSLYGVWGL